MSQKYPKITTECAEELPTEVNGHLIPVDYSKPNPNGFEIDNLYLDMNGIIHPCCHPEDKPAPKNEEEMFVEIFNYIDRIMAIVRPRKVLYMAIDGVAPRAKMNQQRSRRFRAALDAQTKIEDEEKLREEYKERHGHYPEEKEHFDSNCITPGTPFMAQLAVALKYYIAERLNSNPAWKNLKIILSDASVPGEGEHKIMDYIRRQRNGPDYDPNTHHVLYGLDADLIMLALGTHEPHFKILREDVNFKPSFDSKQDLTRKPYIFLHVSILREYLEIELKTHDLPFKWDFERAIDDYVFLCFFVGNDFLPHLPSLEIREGAIDTLIEIWKKNLPHFGGYITNSGDIDLKKVQVLLSDLGKVEDEIFKKRRDDEERRRANRKRSKEQAKAREEQQRLNRQSKSVSAIAETMASLPTYSVKMTKEEIAASNRAVIASRSAGIEFGAGKDANKRAADALREQLMVKKRKVVEEEVLEEVVEEEGTVSNDKPQKSGIVEVESQLVEEAVVVVEEEAEAEAEVEEEDDENVVEEVVVTELPPVKKPKVVADDEDEEPADNVRLWEAGWKQRYYQNKFEVDESDIEFRRAVVAKYVEGFCWVLKYYYQGCQSWHWYYPYHYSPFASDFDFIGDLDIQFTLGQPFKPFEQLMGVLPAASRSHIPQAFQHLMTNSDSEIIDFYPEKFPIDLNGKKYAWQGVALLPFIDEERLLVAMSKSYHNLTEEEVKRNALGHELLWVGQFNPTFDKLCLLYVGRKISQVLYCLHKPVPLDPMLTRNMQGAVLPDPDITIPGSTFYSPLSDQGLPDIVDNQAISAVYVMPQYPDGFIFKAFLLRNASLPRRQLDADDYYYIKMGGYQNSRGRYHRGPRGGRVDVHSAGRMIRHAGGRSEMYAYESREQRTNPTTDEFGRERRPQQQSPQGNRPRSGGYAPPPYPQYPGYPPQPYPGYPPAPYPGPYPPMPPGARPIMNPYFRPYPPPPHPSGMQQPPQGNRPPPNIGWSRNVANNRTSNQRGGRN